MKKIFILLICFMFVFNSNGQTKRIIYKDLPKITKDFIDTFYPKRKAIYGFEGINRVREYKIYFSNGTKLEFDRYGKLKSIECGKGEYINKNILPDEINDIIQQHYSSEKIVEYNIDDRSTRYEEHEIEFESGLEITVNGRLNNKY
jgi:hypothetical protein